MKKHILHIALTLLAFPSYSQIVECDSIEISRIAQCFQDTVVLSTRKLICEDPNNPNFGRIGDTTRSRAASILSSEYFENCLKGKNQEYFYNLLGKGDFREGKEVSCGSCSSQIYYSLQTYDENGKPRDPLPSTMCISFNEKNQAKSMSIISY